MERAYELAGSASLMLVVGSALEVYPVAGLPLDTLRAGGALAIVNRGPTAMDAKATLKLDGSAGEILPRVAADALTSGFGGWRKPWLPKQPPASADVRRGPCCSPSIPSARARRESPAAGRAREASPRGGGVATPDSWGLSASTSRLPSPSAVARGIACRDGKDPVKIQDARPPEWLAVPSGKVFRKLGKGTTWRSATRISSAT